MISTKKKNVLGPGELWSCTLPPLIHQLQCDRPQVSHFYRPWDSFCFVTLSLIFAFIHFFPFLRLFFFRDCCNQRHLHTVAFCEYSWITWKIATRWFKEKEERRRIELSTKVFSRVSSQTLVDPTAHCRQLTNHSRQRNCSFIQARCQFWVSAVHYTFPLDINNP